jgi:hypothetical protein
MKNAETFLLKLATHSAMFNLTPHQRCRAATVTNESSFRALPTGLAQRALSAYGPLEYCRVATGATPQKPHVTLAVATTKSSVA